MSVVILDKNEISHNSAGWEVNLSSQDTEPDLKSLLLKIAKKDQRAFSEFYEAFQGPVHSFVNKRCFNKSIVDEVLQDIFVNVWKKASYYKPERGTPEQWLFTVARNRYIQEVQGYNTTVRQFPTNITAKVFGMDTKPNFTVANETEISTAPSVDFGDDATAQ